MRSNLLRRWVPGAMLLVAAGASSALTLGRSQGVALIGRPLDMGIQVMLDSPNDVADLCPEVEVFYGDTRMDPRRVELSTTANGTSAQLRVRTSLPLDEAFVQVYLRVGCNARFTRRYVMLSEQPADVAQAAAVPAPVAPLVAQVAPPAAAVSTRTAPIVPATEAAPSPQSVQPARSAPARAASPGAVEATPAPRPAASKPAPKVPVARVTPPAPAAQPAQGPRLKLDALEVRPRPAASAPALQAASAAAPAASVAPAAEGAAAAPSELERNAERIQALDADLRKLRASMLRSDAALTELRARLEKAEGERYANGLVYSLAGLLVAALGAAFFFWRRSRADAQPARWWVESRQDDGGESLAAEHAALYEESQVPPAAGDAPAPSPSSPSPVRPARAVAAGGTGNTGFGGLGGNPPIRSSLPTETDGLRVSDPLPLTSDELSDIQQEADFFVSLGEYDRAIEILRNHIEAHPQASAVAWLDLLEIHHKLGQKDEYEQLRRDFEWLFNAKAPTFEEFDESRDGLEAHPRLLSRIQAVWPRREALDMIDEAIFRRPGTEGDEPLNLECYRDLLFLHILAAELSADDAVPVAAPSSASAAVASGSPLAAATPVGSLSTLDINLDELLRAAGSEAAHAGAPAAGASADADGHVVDFDLDLSAQFKLPAQRTPQS